MYSNNSILNKFSLSLLLGLLMSGQGMAAVLTFEDGQNVGPTLVRPGSMAPSIFPVGGTFISYQEGGMDHTAISFTNGSQGSHIHGAAGNSNLSNSTARVTELAPDSGGALFRAINPGQRFSFNSWDFDSLDLRLIDPNQFPPVVTGESTLEVRGFLAGNNVASASFDSSFVPTTQLVPVDFLNIDGRFADVDRVEYWFAESGRGGVPGPSASLMVVRLDNVDVTLVPVPAAMYLFASGLMLLLPKGLRRRYFT